MKIDGVIYDPKIIDYSRGIIYTRPTFLERIKMFFGRKFVPIQIKEKNLMDLIPKVKLKGMEFK